MTILERAVEWSKQLPERTRVWLNDDLFTQMSREFAAEFPYSDPPSRPRHGLFIGTVLFQPRSVRHIYWRSK